MTTTSRIPRAQRRAGLNWSNPALLAGRSNVQFAVFCALLIGGAVTDTLAFKTVLDLVLQESPVISWLLAVGITFVALLFAWTIGRLYAYYRHEPEATLPPMLICVGVWVGLGGAMAYIRAHATAGGSAAADGFGATPNPRLALGTAALFAMLYLASGAVAMIEAFQLTNPVHAAYVRVRDQLAAARARVAHLTGQAERADLVVVHHSGELDRDLERRDEAIGGYLALGAELKNYARVLIATLEQDPRATNLTSWGPKALDDPYPYTDGTVAGVADPAGSADVDDVDDDTQGEGRETA